MNTEQAPKQHGGPPGSMPYLTFPSPVDPKKASTEHGVVSPAFCKQNGGIYDAKVKKPRADFGIYGIFDTKVKKPHTNLEILGIFDDEHVEKTQSEEDDDEGRVSPVEPDGNEVKEPRADDDIFGGKGTTMFTTPSRTERFEKGIEFVSAFIDKLAPEMEKANEALARMNQQCDGIPDKDIQALSALKDGIFVSLSDLFHQAEERMEQLDTILERTDNELSGLRKQNRMLVEKINGLEETRLSSQGLSMADKMLLELWGCDSVQSLCSKMDRLQIDLASKWRKPADREKEFTVEATKNTRTNPETLKPKDQPAKMMEPGKPMLEANDSKMSQLSSFLDKSSLVEKSVVKDYPMPKIFKGKNRTEFEEFLFYFEKTMGHKSMTGEVKTDILGECLSGTMKSHHYHLVKKNLSFDEVKNGLLRYLGSDTQLTMMPNRIELNRMKKADDQSYENFLRLVEDKANEAFIGQDDMLEGELKTILFRATQEDLDSSFYSIIVPRASEKYSRLKELVISSELPKLLFKRSQDQEDQERDNFGSRDRLSRSDSTGKDTRQNQNRNRNPDLICFKCQKVGHYANQCQESDNSNRIPLGNGDKIGYINFAPVNSVHCKLQGSPSKIEVVGRKTVDADTLSCASLDSNPGVHTAVLDSVDLAIKPREAEKSWCKRLNEKKFISKGANKFVRRNEFLFHIDCLGVERKVVPRNPSFKQFVKWKGIPIWQ